MLDGQNKTHLREILSSGGRDVGGGFLAVWLAAHECRNERQKPHLKEMFVHQFRSHTQPWLQLSALPASPYLEVGLAKSP